jgi:uncharacterized protein (DUF1800 family)
MRSLHDYGDKIWLGRPVPVKGEAEGEWALDVLASHPSTAHHIAYELTQYFVADDPPPALVETLAQRYVATGGDIRAVLGTLFASPAFRDPKNFGVKFKTPYQYVVSAVRASGIQVNNVKPLLDTLTRLGMPLYGCQSPDGYKNTEEVWLNPDALAQRINFATALGLGKLPLEEAVNTAIPNDPYAKMEVKQVSTETIAPKVSLPSKLNAPIDSDALVSTLGNQISEQTRTRIAIAKPPALRAALALGSPDFMRR